MHWPGFERTKKKKQKEKTKSFSNRQAGQRQSGNARTANEKEKTKAFDKPSTACPEKACFPDKPGRASGFDGLARAGPGQAGTASGPARPEAGPALAARPLARRPEKGGRWPPSRFKRASGFRWPFKPRCKNVTEEGGHPITDGKIAPARRSRVR